MLEKYEKALDDVLPQAFAIVKDTARRFSENPKLVVTATDFDRELAAQGKDFVRIKAIRLSGRTIGLLVVMT